MEDRNAFTDNKIERGVDPDTAKNSRTWGVVAGSYPGLVPAVDPLQGIPENQQRGNILRSDYFVMPEKKSPPSCGGITKKGLPCKAHPVKDEGYCVGHMRANDVRGN